MPVPVPVTIPVLPIATADPVLLHTPPAVPSDSTVVLPLHTLSEPVILVGGGSTVIAWLTVQPVPVL